MNAPDVVDLDSGTGTPVNNVPVASGDPAGWPDGTRLVSAWDLATLGRIYSVPHQPGVTGCGWGRAGG